MRQELDQPILSALMASASTRSLRTKHPQKNSHGAGRLLYSLWGEPEAFSLRVCCPYLITSLPRHIFWHKLPLLAGGEAKGWYPGVGERAGAM